MSLFEQLTTARHSQSRLRFLVYRGHSCHEHGFHAERGPDILIRSRPRCVDDIVTDLVSKMMRHGGIFFFFFLYFFHASESPNGSIDLDLMMVPRPKLLGACLPPRSCDTRRRCVVVPIWSIYCAEIHALKHAGAARF